MLATGERSVHASYTWLARRQPMHDASVVAVKILTPNIYVIQ